MKEEVKFTKCWGDVIKSCILLQDVSSAAEPVRAPLSQEISYTHWELENSSQLWCCTGFHQIWLFLLLCPPLKSHKIKPTWWEQASDRPLCFFPICRTIHATYRQISFCRAVILSHTMQRAAFTFPGFHLSCQFPLAGGSSVMPPRDGGGRFLPVRRQLESRSPVPAEVLQTSPACLVPDPLTHFPISVFPIEQHSAGGN